MTIGRRDRIFHSSEHNAQPGMEIFGGNDPMDPEPQASTRNARLATALTAMALAAAVALSVTPAAQAAAWERAGGGDQGRTTGGPGDGTETYSCRSVDQEVGWLGTGVFFHLGAPLLDGLYCTVQVEVQYVALGGSDGGSRPCRAPSDGLGACLVSTVWTAKAPTTDPRYHDPCFTSYGDWDCMIGGGRAYTETASTTLLYTTTTVAKVGGLDSRDECTTIPDSKGTASFCWTFATPGVWQPADHLCGEQTSTAVGLVPEPSQTTQFCGYGTYMGF